MFFHCEVQCFVPFLSTGEQTHLEHAEVGAAIRHLWLSLLEDCEGVDLQARLRQGQETQASDPKGLEK